MNPRCNRVPVWLVLALGCVAPVMAQPAGTGQNAPRPDKPLERPSPDMPQWLRDRQGVVQDADALTRKELFRLQDMTFSFLDPAAAGQFVRIREDGLREATVRIDNRANNARHVFMLRALCKDGQYYLGPPVSGNAPLKPPEAGSVAELLVKEACG